MILDWIVYAIIATLLFSLFLGIIAIGVMVIGAILGILIDGLDHIRWRKH